MMIMHLSKSNDQSEDTFDKEFIKARTAGVLDISNREIDELPETILRLHKFEVPKVGSWLLVPPKKFVFKNNQLKSLFDVEVQDDSNDDGNLKLKKQQQQKQKQQKQEQWVHVMQHCTSFNVFNNCIERIGEGVLRSLTSMTRVTLARNQLTTLPELPPSVTYLDVSHNQLTSIDCCTVASFAVHLRVLLAGNNRLGDVAAAAELPELVELDLAHNRLQQIVIAGGRLSRLLLNNNRLKSLRFLHSDGDAVGCLKELFVGDNQLRELPDDQLSALVTLNAARNMLTRVPRLPATVQHLDLSSNDIRRLPAQFGDQLVHLRTLVLEGNPIRSIKRTLLCGGSAPLIAHLRAKYPPLVVSSQEQHGSNGKENGCGLTDFQRRQTMQTGEMKVSRKISSSLKWTDFASVLVNLDMSSCDLQAIPAAFSKMPKLSHLNVSKNQLTSLKGIPLTLVFIDASANRLTEIGPLAECSSLEIARLSQNRIAGVNIAGKGWRCLCELDLTTNAISDAQFVRWLPGNSLQVLKIASNKLPEFPVEFLVEWQVLQALDLRCNDLKTLDPRVSTIGTLKVLLLEGNRLRSLNRYISKGSSAVLEALNRRLPVPCQ